MAEEKISVVSPIKRAGCFVGNVEDLDAKCTFKKCGRRRVCMWNKDREKLSPQLGSMPENRKVILSR